MHAEWNSLPCCSPHVGVWLLRARESRGRVLRPLAVVNRDRRLRRREGAICTDSHVRLRVEVLRIASESRHEDVSLPGQSA